VDKHHAEVGAGYGWPVDVEALIGETAAIVATGYASLDVSNAAGLLLDARYEGEAWQLMPLALELTSVHEHVGRDGEQRELGEPAFDPGSEAVAKCEALNDALCAADDGWVRIEDYWLALASELQARLRVPVLVDEIEMPIAEQLRRQQHAAPAADAFEGLEVILSLRIDEHRHAGLFVRDEMIFGSAHLPDVSDAWLVERATTEIGRSPQVLGGGLPRGAVSAEVRDRKGVWHAAVTIPGLWLCVLPQRSGQDDPEVRFRDLAGNPPPHHEDDFSAGVALEDPPDAVSAQAAKVLSGAQVPALWPRQVSGRPELYAWEGEAGAATALGLAGGGHRVRIAPSSADPRQTFEQHLVRDWRYGAETAAARAQRVPITTLEGSIDGTPVTLDLVAPQEPWMRDEGWVAIAPGDHYAVTITGYKNPPERLDFEPLK
jgi:hypothetical protein